MKYSFGTLAPAIFAVTMALTLAPTSALAEKDSIADLPPLPRVSAASAKSMATAFSSVPVTCRMEVQRQLTSYGFYDGPVNGMWSEEVAHAVARWVGGLQTVAYGWPTVAGSMGILWSIGASEMACPMPPYDL